MKCYTFKLVGLKFDSDYFSKFHKITEIHKQFIKPLHTVISCDSSGDEYYMINRVFEFTYRRPGGGKVGYCAAHLFRSFKKGKTPKKFCAVVETYFDSIQVFYL